VGGARRKREGEGSDISLYWNWEGGRFEEEIFREALI